MSTQHIYQLTDRLRAVLNIEHDLYAESPRSDENATKMWCWHRNYDLGDNDRNKPSDHIPSMEELKEVLEQQGEKLHIAKPLYLYDHSGITISTSPFSCRWDSGQVGYVFLTQSDFESDCPYTAQNQRHWWADHILNRETEIYDEYLTGQWNYAHLEIQKFTGSDEDLEEDNRTHNDPNWETQYELDDASITDIDAWCLHLAQMALERWLQKPHGDAELVAQVKQVDISAVTSQFIELRLPEPAMPPPPEFMPIPQLDRQVPTFA